MEWEKKGHIFSPLGNFHWNKSHAQVPTALLFNDTTIRIFYASRNAENKSYTSFIDVNANNPHEITYIHENPILDHGPIGTFDESGIMPSSIIRIKNEVYLYYIGWSKRLAVPYHNSIGLAISKDNGFSFRKIGEGPLFDVNFNEPYFTGTSYVFKDNSLFRMYYLSCIKWQELNGKIEPFYNIKYASSVDGINWNRQGKIAIDLIEDEGGLASASVIKENNIYRMWYCFRKGFDYRTNIENSYRIGYAHSFDAINWVRKDAEVGIELSLSGWDSQMIAYPNVIKYKDKTYMFYNGNGFGKTGFGYAILNG